MRCFSDLAECLVSQNLVLQAAYADTLCPSQDWAPGNKPEDSWHRFVWEGIQCEENTIDYWTF